MQTKTKYNLQRTMIVYFLLIGIASLMVGIEFMIDFSNPYKGLADKPAISAEASGLQGEQVKIFERMRKKALVMVGTIMAVTLIILTMFIRNISDPLQHMIDLAKAISAGDLNHTINIQADNELNELGCVINEMASNLQEILMLSKGFCSSGKEAVAEMQGYLHNGRVPSPDELKDLQELVSKLDSEMSELEEVVELFNFYTGEKQDGNADLDR